MVSNAAAYYLWPGVWIGSAPPDSDNDIDVRILEEETYRTNLSSGIAAKVLREGIFVFDFSDWAPGRALPANDEFDFDAAAALLLQRAAVLNAHLVCLYTAVSRVQRRDLQKMIVSPSDLIQSNSLDDPNASWSDQRLTPLLTARYPVSYPLAFPRKFDWRISGRVVLDIESVEESFHLLAKVFDHPSSHALQLADLLAQSCKAYDDHNYNLCLITAWAITEKLLNRLWARYVEENRERELEGEKTVFINRERKKKLEESRDFNASVISEVLSLTNHIPFSLYENMTGVRQARNEWLHDLRPVSREMAVQSIQIAERMLELLDDVRLQVPLGLRLSADVGPGP